MHKFQFKYQENYEYIKLSYIKLNSMFNYRNINIQSSDNIVFHFSILSSKRAKESKKKVKMCVSWSTL